MLTKKELAHKIEELIEIEKAKTCGSEASSIYSKRQKKRFATTFDICKKYVPDRHSRVLDIGRSNLTYMLSQYYSHVFTLGYDLTVDAGGHRETVQLGNVEHITYDLNESKNPETWPDYPNSFDLIVYCETLEHLTTPPEFSLLMLKYLLKPGGFIIVTTPNAVSIHKRIIILMGKNPYERIRYYGLNPGHFREYTKEELVEIAELCNLKIVECRTINFKPSKYFVLRCLKRIPPFKDTILAVFSG